MANPQLENGHIEIAMEIWEALTAYRLPGEQMQVLMFIIRKTYGWQKKRDAIALSQFEKATGINKPNISRAISGLSSKNLIIVIKKDNGQANIYEFVKDFEKWVPLSKKITLSKKIKPIIKKDNEIAQPIESTLETCAIIKKDNEIAQPIESTLETCAIIKKDNVIKKDKASLSKKINTKDTTTKENYSLVETVQFRLSDHLFKFIFKRRPTFKKPDFKEWATHIDRMIRIDKRTPEEIKKVIDWCQQDDFWQNNILSTSKLRKQFDTLALKMERDQNSVGSVNAPYYQELI